MEEIKNENVNDIEEIEEVEAAPEGSGVIEVAAIVVGAVVAVGAGIGALVYKNREKMLVRYCHSQKGRARIPGIIEFSNDFHILKTSRTTILADKNPFFGRSDSPSC